jgi:serine/threonine protein kinase
MLVGKYPYKGESRIDLLNNIINKKADFSQLRISDAAKAFIQGCLTYDPKKRITWK